jgi:hypothetical protein
VSKILFRVRARSHPDTDLTRTRIQEPDYCPLDISFGQKADGSRWGTPQHAAQIPGLVVGWGRSRARHTKVAKETVSRHRRTKQYWPHAHLPPDNKVVNP